MWGLPFLSPLRLIIGGACVVFLWAAYVRITDKAWNDGYSEGSTKALEEQREVIEAEKEKALEEIAVEQAKVDSEKVAVEDAMKQLHSVRWTIKNDLNIALDKAFEGTDDEKAAIDSSDRVGRIRAIRHLLATHERLDLDERISRRAVREAEEGSSGGDSSSGGDGRSNGT